MGTNNGVKTVRTLADETSIYEFIKRFPDERSAFEYIEGRRWPNGVVCPHCESTDTYRWPDYRYHECRGCKKVFTVRTGTVFERSHVPLDKWLLTIYLMNTSRKGISSVQLAKMIGVTQKTAWFMLHRLREACEDTGELLSGIVEIDETYVGGKRANKYLKKGLTRRGRGVAGKQPVLGLREREGRVVLLPVTDTRGPTLEREIRLRIKQGAVLYTDEYGSYYNLHKWYRHDAVSHSEGEYMRGEVTTNGIESVWAVLKRGYRGIYHQWSPKHTHRYANEFAFRLNKSGLTQMMNDLLSGAEGKRLTYQELTT